MKYERDAVTASELAEARTLTRAGILRRLPEWKEETLVTLIRGWEKNGDGAAVDAGLDALLVKIDAYLTPALRRRLTNKEAREEAAQEVYLRVFAAVLSPASGESFWERNFRHCLKLRLWDVLRKAAKGKGAKPTQSFVQDDGTDTSEWLPDPSLLTPEISALKGDALARLTDQEREAFLRTHSGETQEEIASVMGISDRTVRNLLKRVEKMLTVWRAESEETP